MSKINIVSIVIKDDHAKFLDPFSFEITFECEGGLGDDLAWKLIYVGSAESASHDQTLDTVVVGPIIPGRHMFVFDADPPKPQKIPTQDAVGVTVILLTCSYRNQEFVRVGYYINIDYDDDPELKENPPLEPDFSKLTRHILASCPRVTKFKIDWAEEQQNSGKEPQNLGHEQQNLGHEPQNFGKEPQNFGKEPQNFGKEPQNFGKAPHNFGKEPQHYYEKSYPAPFSTFVPPFSDHSEDNFDYNKPLTTLMGYRTKEKVPKEPVDALEELIANLTPENSSSNSHDDEAMQM